MKSRRWHIQYELDLMRRLMTSTIVATAERNLNRKVGRM